MEEAHDAGQAGDVVHPFDGQLATARGGSTAYLVALPVTGRPVPGLARLCSYYDRCDPGAGDWVMRGEGERCASAEALVDAVSGASRALGAVAARSLAPLANRLTLAQYQLLVELATRGPQHVDELASTLGTGCSAVNKMCERLVRMGLVRRLRGRGDRKNAEVVLAPLGRDTVEHVTCRRRSEVARALRRLPRASRGAVLVSLGRFADAAGVL